MPSKLQPLEIGEFVVDPDELYSGEINLPPPPNICVGKTKIDKSAFCDCEGYISDEEKDITKAYCVICDVLIDPIITQYQESNIIHPKNVIDIVGLTRPLQAPQYYCCDYCVNMFDADDEAHFDNDFYAQIFKDTFMSKEDFIEAMETLKCQHHTFYHQLSRIDLMVEAIRSLSVAIDDETSAMRYKLEKQESKRNPKSK